MNRSVQIPSAGFCYTNWYSWTRRGIHLPLIVEKVLQQAERCRKAHLNHRVCLFPSHHHPHLYKANLALLTSNQFWTIVPFCVFRNSYYSTFINYELYPHITFLKLVSHSHIWMKNTSSYLLANRKPNLSQDKKTELSE